MSSNNLLKFDAAEQLKQIEAFTEQQQQDVQALITQTRSQCNTDELLESASKVESEVSDLLNDIGVQLEQEINNINQQLQQLLPSEIQ